MVGLDRHALHGLSEPGVHLRVHVSGGVGGTGASAGGGIVARARVAGAATNEGFLKRGDGAKLLLGDAPEGGAAARGFAAGVGGTEVVAVGGGGGAGPRAGAPARGPAAVAVARGVRVHGLLHEEGAASPGHVPAAEGGAVTLERSVPARGINLAQAFRRRRHLEPAHLKRARRRRTVARASPGPGLGEPPNRARRGDGFLPGRRPEDRGRLGARIHLLQVRHRDPERTRSSPRPLATRAWSQPHPRTPPARPAV